jgi:hypothetical protein
MIGWNAVIEIERAEESVLPDALFPIISTSRMVGWR